MTDNGSRGRTKATPPPTPTDAGLRPPREARATPTTAHTRTMKATATPKINTDRACWPSLPRSLSCR
eukprot:15449454-Alexandrium_andersonii.AAC.1